MKRTFQFLTLVAVCCAVMVSCKNAKTTEPTPEEIQAQKVALADSVLTEIDSFVDEYVMSAENTFFIPNFKLTEKEKMVMPDYLLDPSVAGTLVTKSQKVNALAIYIVDCGIRIIYDMPLEETKEVIAKLAVEINTPIDVNLSTDLEVPASEKIKMEYESCKKRGDLAYFWQFQNAIMVETSFILAQNPDLFFNKIKDEQWQAYINRLKSKKSAVHKLAKFDPEMAVLYDFIQQFSVRSSVKPSAEEIAAICSSCDAAKKYFTANNEQYIVRRNALLQ